MAAGKTSLRDEIRGLRQAFEDIKRDLPISEGRGKGSDGSSEGLLSFRPTKASRDLPDIDSERFEPTLIRTTKSGGSYRDEGLQKDLSDIKEKIESLRSTLMNRSEQQSPQEKEVQTQILDIRTAHRSKSSKRQRLQEELSKLQAENRVLRELVTTTLQSPQKTPLRKRNTAKAKKTRCNNCAFLKSKGFENGLCYRHRGHSLAWK